MDASAISSMRLGELRVGRRTLDSTERANLRFSFVGDGPASTRTIVGDTARAALLLDSPAGPRLERALHRFASGADGHVGADNLRSITLAPDVDAVAGASFLNWTRRNGIQIDLPVLPEQLAGWREAAAQNRAHAKSMDYVNGAFNGDGDIVVTPEVSRMLLAAVGAYDPIPTERAGTRARDRVNYLSGLLRHEVEHSVTPDPGFYGDVPGLDGIEEGTAEALTSARPVVAASRHDLPSAWRRYGRTDAQSRRAVEGWDPYPVAPPHEADKRSTSNATYGVREQTVDAVLRLAGVDRHTRAGYAKARELLQSVPVSGVPDLLAAALVERYGIDPRLHDELGQHIRDITIDGDLNRVRQLDQWITEHAAS